MKKFHYLHNLLFFLAIPTSLCAQEASLRNNTKTAKFPLQLNEKALTKYHSYPWDRKTILQLFKQDTVPIQEIKERFYRTVNTEPRLHYFPQNDSSVAIYGVQNLLVSSPLATCPIKKARKMRGVWDSPYLRLVALLDENGKKDTVLYRKLVNKFTPNMKEYQQGNPTWFEGDITMLRAPRWYMDFVVSALPLFFHYEKGERTVMETVHGESDYFSSLIRSFDGTWNMNIPSGMQLFADAINRDVPSVESPSVSFTFLLHIKKDKSCDIEMLLPQVPDENTQKAFEELQNYVIHLRPGLFKPLYTSDNRVFPCRYLQAWHDSKGWQIADILTTNPNIPERKLHSEKLEVSTQSK